MINSIIFVSDLIKVTGPNNEQLYTSLQFESSQIEVVARNYGAHSVCWSNEMARWTAKVVSFDLVIDGQPTKPTSGSNTPNKEEVVTPCTRSICDRFSLHQHCWVPSMNLWVEFLDCWTTFKRINEHCDRESRDIETVSQDVF